MSLRYSHQKHIFIILRFRVRILPFEVFQMTKYYCLRISYAIAITKTPKLLIIQKMPTVTKTTISPTFYE